MSVDVWTMLVVWCALGVGSFCVLRNRRKRAASRHWPIARATCRRGEIVKPHRSRYRLDMRYSYIAGGEAHIGRYTELFFDRDEAHRTLSSFEQRLLCVRCNPAAPGDYFMDPHRDFGEITVTEGRSTILPPLY